MTDPLKPLPFVTAILNQLVQPGDTLLDVACGRADYRHSTQGRYIGADRADIYGGHIDVFCDADSLPFNDGTIDVVMTKSAFFQFPDPARTLHEYARVLKPGGRLLLVDYNRRTQKRLEVAEGEPRPKWTAAGLAWRVRRAGFRQVSLLCPREQQPSGLKRLAVLTVQEARGQWAVVTAVRP